MITTSFINDTKQGELGENIFVRDFLQFYKIRYENVTNNPNFQKN